MISNSVVNKYENVLSPLKVGPLEIRNRILVSAHQPVLAENGKPTGDYIQYQRTVAAGGAGLQITGAQSVHPTGMNELTCLVNHDDSIIPGYRELAKAVHEEGGRILAQLTHFGATGWTGVLDEPAWAPSPIASEIMRITPHEMTVEEIQEVVEAFGDAAKRAKEGGLDGVEITGAHGMLISAFTSGYANHRTDQYGGSLENRLRFLLEVLENVHKKVGDDFIIGVRFTADEKVEGGVDITQAKEIAQILERTGIVDYLNVIAGTNLDRFQRWEHWPATPAPHGLYVDLARQVKEVVNIPVFAVGRVTDPALAEKIVSEGSADMVAMTRGHIADPEIIKKIKEGRVEDIRPCVGSNYCIKQVLEGKPVRCLYNPEAGRSNHLGPITKVDTPKKVVVIGGGPAGLEAARVAALRGHEVELFERSGSLGGQLRLWANTPTMKELEKSVRWLESQIRKLNVKIHLNYEVTKEMALSLDADEIIVATGAQPIESGQVPWVPSLTVDSDTKITMKTPHQVLNEEKVDAKRVVIWDHAGGEAGSQMAVSAAEYLLNKGVEVEIIAPTFSVAEDVHPTLRTPLFKRLLSGGAILTPNSKIARIQNNEVVIQNVYSGEEKVLTNIDTVVTWFGNKANDALYHTFKNSGLQNVSLIGDAVAPRTVEAVTNEAAILSRKL